MLLPAEIGDYTDFYVGIHHAGQRRQALPPGQPAAAELQVGAHRLPRAGVHRAGQRRAVSPAERPAKAGPDAPPGVRAHPAARPRAGARHLDRPGNELGEPVRIGRAAEHVAGFCLLNDWSARDVQAWEYQPLGPFLAKNFATTVSRWVITPEALAPYRAGQHRPGGGSAPLPYLADERDQRSGALDVDLEVQLQTERMRDERPAGVPAVPFLDPAPVLDVGAADHPSHQRRLPAATGRPAGQRHDLGPHRGRFRESAGDHPAAAPGRSSCRRGNSAPSWKTGTRSS